MATRTPGPMTPGTAVSSTEIETETETETESARTTAEERERGQPLVDHARDGPTAATVSRAVRPPVAVAHKRLPRDGFGEAFLVWRCLDCGLVGSLDALPERCLCGARREALSYVIED